MINKLILISIFCVLVFSCGKKGDPKYSKNEIVFLKSKNTWNILIKIFVLKKLMFKI